MYYSHSKKLRIHEIARRSLRKFAFQTPPNTSQVPFEFQPIETSKEIVFDELRRV